MTNDEARMTTEDRNSANNGRNRCSAGFLHSSLGHSFVIRISALVILAICSLSMFCCGCAGIHNSDPRDSSPHLVGRVSGNSYTSPQGHFTVSFPVSREVGGRILRDDAQSVTFYDNWGSRISFYSKPFNSQSPLMSPPQSEARAKALETFMQDIYGNSIVPHYHSDILDGTITFIQLKPVGPKAGVATCIRQNRVYLVETDLLPGVELLSRDDESSQQAREVWLENRAMELLQSMEIK